MKIEKIFTADQFTPTQWDTAQDKADFANRFIAFIKAGFPQSGFTKKFYTRLSMTFGHIAHFNQGGFWDVWFSTNKKRLGFIEHTLEHPCYGHPQYTYCDVERAIQAHLRTLDLGAVYQRIVANEIETYERAELARLQAKYN